MKNLCTICSYNQIDYSNSKILEKWKSEMRCKKTTISYLSRTKENEKGKVNKIPQLKIKHTQVIKGKNI